MIPESLHLAHSFECVRVLFRSYGSILTFKYTQTGPSHLIEPNPIITDSTSNAVGTTELNFAIGCIDNSVHVHNSATLNKVYVLLGGSMNPRLMPKSFVPNPRIQGCSMLAIDDEKIVAVFGNLIRVYEFD